MAGTTGKRAKAPGMCSICGKRITADFIRDRKIGDAHVECVYPNGPNGPNLLKGD